MHVAFEMHLIIRICLPFFSIHVTGCKQRQQKLNLDLLYVEFQMIIFTREEESVLVLLLLNGKHERETVGGLSGCGPLLKNMQK